MIEREKFWHRSQSRRIDNLVELDIKSIEGTCAYSIRDFARDVGQCSHLREMEDGDYTFSLWAAFPTASYIDYRLSYVYRDQDLHSPFPVSIRVDRP